MLKNRAVYKQWLLERLAAEAPIGLVPAHGDLLRGSAHPGEVVDRGLGARLEALARGRL